jgi:AhpD family alkylhydroperoxidase
MMRKRAGSTTEQIMGGSDGCSTAHRNNCGYCIATHTASAQKKGMTDAMFGELMAVIGMANETNGLATGISN